MSGSNQSNRRVLFCVDLCNDLRAKREAKRDRAKAMRRGDFNRSISRWQLFRGFFSLGRAA